VKERRSLSETEVEEGKERRREENAEKKGEKGEKEKERKETRGKEKEEQERGKSRKGRETEREEREGEGEEEEWYGDLRSAVIRCRREGRGGGERVDAAIQRWTCGSPLWTLAEVSLSFTHPFVCRVLRSWA